MQATGNSYLLNFFDAIWGRAISALAYHDFYVHSPHDAFVAEHEALIKEIATGDPVRARRAMIEHIAWGLERTVKGAAAKPPAPARPGAAGHQEPPRTRGISTPG